MINLLLVIQFFKIKMSVKLSWEIYGDNEETDGAYTKQWCYRLNGENFQIFLSPNERRREDFVDFINGINGRSLLDLEVEDDMVNYTFSGGKIFFKHADLAPQFQKMLDDLDAQGVFNPNFSGC